MSDVALNAAHARALGAPARQRIVAYLADAGGPVKLEILDGALEPGDRV